VTTYPLEGYRIIDFGWAAAAPRATCLLADMGAEVIKVETQKRLDPVRFGPDNLTRDPEKDPLFHSINRNKLSILLDLTHPQGVELIKQLVKISDVVVENFSPGVMKRFGLDYDELKEIKPEIIMISFPGVGREGPLADVVTYGPSLAGLAGLDSMVGYEDEPVLGMQQAYADINAALHGAFAIQIALYHRETYGEGQHIEIPQIEALLSTMPEPVMANSITGSIPGTIGNRSNLMAVHNNYPCMGTDKWVSIALLTEQEWKAFCKAIGSPSWTKTDSYADGYRRWVNRKELDRQISEWTMTKMPSEVMEILQKVGVAATPCEDTEDRFLDPHFQERQILVDVEHPSTGVDWVPNVICRLSETPGAIRRPAPRLGEHNDYVFGELLGLTKEEIERLIENKIIF
jgi:crotonobetainyl-CoA:carnitine CoA-transferase CaiB-like acyl-CoA transferase